MKKIKLDNWTRLQSYFCTDRNTIFVILQYADNSVIAYKQEFNTGVKTEIRSPLLKNFFKVCQWIKTVENISDRDVYINRVNRQID